MIRAYRTVSLLIVFISIILSGCQQSDGDKHPATTAPNSDVLTSSTPEAPEKESPTATSEEPEPQSTPTAKPASGETSTPEATAPSAAPTPKPTVSPSLPTPEPTAPSATPTPEPTAPSATPTPEPTAPPATPTPEPTAPPATPTPTPTVNLTGLYRYQVHLTNTSGVCWLSEIRPHLTGTLMLLQAGNRVEVTSVQSDGGLVHNERYSGTINGTEVAIEQAIRLPVSTSLGSISFTLQGRFSGTIQDSSNFSLSGSGNISPGNCSFQAVAGFQK